jgi:hypothetical protein
LQKSKPAFLMESRWGYSFNGKNVAEMVDDYVKRHEHGNAPKTQGMPLKRRKENHKRGGKKGPLFLCVEKCLCG